MRKTCPGQMPGAQAKAAPGIARRNAEMRIRTMPCAGSQSGTTCLPAGRPLLGAFQAGQVALGKLIGLDKWATMLYIISAVKRVVVIKKDGDLVIRVPERMIRDPKFRLGVLVARGYAPEEGEEKRLCV